MAQLKSTIIQGSLGVTNNIVASKIIKQGGLSTQFLMADGSVKSAADFASNRHTHNFTPAGTVSSSFSGTKFETTPTFTGTEDTISYKYTPAGTITAPTFTGTEGSGTVEYTPAGTVSKPTFTGDNLTSTGKFTPAGTVEAPTITVTPNTGTINSITDVGSLPSWNSSYDAATQNVTISWNAGSLPTKGSNTTVVTGIQSATSSTPKFTGTQGDVSVTGKPTGTVSQPTFSGTKANITIKITPQGTISAPTFNGTEATLSTKYTPAGTISKITHTPAGTVSSTFTGTAGTTGSAVEPS